MDKEQVLIKMRRVRYNLENAQEQLSYAKRILNDSIKFNNDGFKNDKITELNDSIEIQVNVINNRIIPGINNM